MNAQQTCECNNGNNDMHNLSIYVANRPGVLARIAQVFARRGFNIDSLVVSPSVDGHYSRMTITAQGSPDGLDQVMRQLGKLIDVIHCADHTAENIVAKEMALIKVAAGEQDRTPALQVADHFGAKTVDLTDRSMIVLATGNTDKIDALLGMLSKYKIVELVRTGKVVMARGEKAT